MFANSAIVVFGALRVNKEKLVLLMHSHAILTIILYSLLSHLEKIVLEALKLTHFTMWQIKDT